MKTILITGATGFLGSHLAEELLNQGFTVVALMRSTSNFWRCNAFMNKIRWINYDNLSCAEQEIINCKPEIMIHAAWHGVKATDRNNWIEQEKNLAFLVSLFEVVKKTTISKIIALGSQAEYGRFEGAVEEDYPLNPNCAYGVNKVCVSYLLKLFSEQNNIDWYWIRIFSVFGPREEKHWLIPAAIDNLLNGKEMKLTSCEQQYDYLYTKDFVAGIISVIRSTKSISGIFNMSSGLTVKLKDILLFLQKNLSSHQEFLKIGSLEYRPNQVMHMQGISDRFFQSFNFKPMFSVYEGLKETSDYYVKLRNNGKFIYDE